VAKKGVVLEGFLLDLNSPDSESLAVTVDCSDLAGERYLALIRELEDRLSEVDKSYAERAVKGRSLKGRYRRHLSGLRTRRLTFIPYPSRMVNVPGNLRRSLYQTVNRECLSLQRETLGRRHRVVYLLPFTRAPDFMLYVDRLNKQITALNKELETLRRTEVEDVLKILDTYGVNGETSVPTRLHGFSVNPRPIRLDPTIIEELVEQRYKAQLVNLREEERRGYELLRQELETQRRTLVIEAVNNLRDQLEAIASRIVGAKKINPAHAKTQLQRLKEIAESTGLTALAESVITPLIQAIDDPEQTEALLGNKDPTKGVSERTQALINSL